MATTYKGAGGSITSIVENKKRKVVMVKAPVCWFKNHRKSISLSSYGVYNQPYKADGTAHTYINTVRYKLKIPLKAATAVVVEVHYKIVTEPNPSPAGADHVSAEDLEAAKTKMRAGVAAHWNGQYSLEIDDPLCGKKVLPIKFKVVWVTSGEHYTLRVRKVFNREQVSGSIVDVSVTTLEWVYAHEFGHCVGLPDEYSYTADVETVRYYKPDGTLGAAITVNPAGEAAEPGNSNIMSTHSSTVVKKRHMWQVAIEAQKLLRPAIGRQIKCDIV